MRSAWRQFAASLPKDDADHRPHWYRAEQIEEFPEAVRRYFHTALPDGVPRIPAAQLRMHGQIKIGRWLPFHARQLLAPHVGAVWEARVAGLIRGREGYLQGNGGMDWKLLGVRTMLHADGHDVARSFAEGVAVQSIFAPAAMLPASGATWTALDDNTVMVGLTTGGHPVRLVHQLDEEGHVQVSRCQRWGDPTNSGRWAPLPFGVHVTDYKTFSGITIPAAGRVGWYIGTDKWPLGEFLRYRITAYRLLPIVSGAVAA